MSTTPTLTANTSQRQCVSPHFHLFVWVRVPGGAVIAGKARATSTSSSGKVRDRSFAKDVISSACHEPALGSSPCWTSLKHLPGEALWRPDRVPEPRLFLMWRMFLYSCSCWVFEQVKSGLSSPSIRF